MSLPLNTMLPRPLSTIPPRSLLDVTYAEVKMLPGRQRRGPGLSGHSLGAVIHHGVLLHLTGLSGHSSTPCHLGRSSGATHGLRKWMIEQPIGPGMGGRVTGGLEPWETFKGGLEPGLSHGSREGLSHVSLLWDGVRGGGRGGVGW